MTEDEPHTTYCHLRPFQAFFFVRIKQKHFQTFRSSTYNLSNIHVQYNQKSRSTESTYNAVLFQFPPNILKLDL